MRDHGRSDKPRECYSDSQLWADDLQAVIQALDLDHPVLCGWSCGPLVILDYLMATGHACFWDDAAGYNRCLQEFVEAL